VRENNSSNDVDSLQVPPLRDHAAPAPFLHLMPAAPSSYPAAAGQRKRDILVPVDDIEDRGFVVFISVGSPPAVGEKARWALPGLDPNMPPFDARFGRQVMDRYEFQVALIWLTEDVLPYPERETWSLVRLPEGGDHLPRPMGGTSTPSVWERHWPPKK
jgi:hypothetical protein